MNNEIKKSSFARRGTVNIPTYWFDFKRRKWKSEKETLIKANRSTAQVKILRRIWSKTPIWCRIKFTSTSSLSWDMTVWCPAVTSSNAPEFLDLKEKILITTFSFRSVVDISLLRLGPTKSVRVPARVGCCQQTMFSRETKTKLQVFCQSCQL